MHTICSAFYTELIRRQPDETQAEQLRRFYDVFDRRCLSAEPQRQAPSLAGF